MKNIDKFLFFTLGVNVVINILIHNLSASLGWGLAMIFCYNFLENMTNKDLIDRCVHFNDMKILTWEQSFIQIAKIIAQRSKDPNTQAGAVLVSEDNKILGVGYNGYPRGIEPKTWEREGVWLDTKYPYVCHAEINAIFNATMMEKNCKMFCTLFPCNECAKAIIQNGIKKVYFIENKHENDPIYVASKRLFHVGNVDFIKIDQSC